MTSDQYGRVDLGISTPISLVFYIINQNEAFAIGESLSSSTPVPFFGIYRASVALSAQSQCYRPQFHICLGHFGACYLSGY